MNILILGAGHRQIRWLPLVDGDLNNSEEWPDGTVTLDNNPNCKPNVLHDLNGLWPGDFGKWTTGINSDGSVMRRRLHFPDNHFDEIHAYEVLEHTGTQGDYQFFFWQFSDFYRILKSDGHLYGSVPMYDSMWAFGDPSHRRVIPDGSFVFLSQQQYIDQCDGPVKTPMSDFRHIYKADFEVEMLMNNNGTLFFDLRAVKPSRIGPSTPEEIGSIAT